MYQIDSSQLPSNDQRRTQHEQTIVQAHIAVIRTLDDVDYAALRAFAFERPENVYDQVYLQRAFLSLDWKARKLLLDEKWADHYNDRHEATYRGVH